MWPDGDVFGEEDADPEDEFMTLREILFAEMKRPDGMPDSMMETGIGEEVRYCFFFLLKNFNLNAHLFTERYTN